MNATISTRLTIPRLNIHSYTRAAIGMAVLAALCTCMSPTPSFAAEEPLLNGRVSSSRGGPLAGIPVRAHRENSNITVSVYTNRQGEYSFPEWSEVAPGSYNVAIELPDFEHVNREAVMLTSGKATRLDFTLQSRQPLLSEATAAEIAVALPGSDDMKFLLTQCSNCHSLQRALRNPHTKQEWAQIISRMAGERRVSRDAPGTRAYGQKRFLEPLADYLASIRGPGSSDQLPFQLRPRPTGEASTGIVVTEYDILRGGRRELSMLRGDRRFAWPHDIIVDANYGWYTDHFSYVLGRLDKKTGEVKEFPYSIPSGSGRVRAPAGQARAGNPGGGSHDLTFDPQGNVVFGLRGATISFNPKTEQFTPRTSGSNMFGMDTAGNVWHTDDEGTLYKIDMGSGEVREYTIPPNEGTYDMEVDSQGRSILNVWREGKIGMFDPRTEEYADFPTPTPQSGPRRGEIDAQDRLWVGLYFAGRIGMFDANKGEVKEFPLIPGTKPFGPPFLAPYSVSVDNKNQLVWATDFNDSRIFRFDMRTEKTTEFFMPAPYEVRDLTVDRTADRPTLWIPAYRPPSKMVKVQVR